LTYVIKLFIHDLVQKLSWSLTFIYKNIDCELTKSSKTVSKLTIALEIKIEIITVVIGLLSKLLNKTVATRIVCVILFVAYLPHNRIEEVVGLFLRIFMKSKYFDFQIAVNRIISEKVQLFDNIEPLNEYTCVPKKAALFRKF
jgi:hypothetical protein